MGHLERVLLEDLVTRQQRGAVDHEADLERGPAHVSRDHVPVTAGGGDEGRARQAARGPRADRGQRPGACDVHRDHAAVRLHDERRTRQTALAERLGELFEVGAGGRPDVRVDDGRDRALILALARRGLVRDRHVKARRLLLDDLAQTALVGGVAKRPHERDGDRLEVLARQQRAHRLAGGVVVHRGEHLAVHRHPLDDLRGAPARHERYRLVGAVHAVHLVDRDARRAPGAAHHQESVVVALRGEQADARSLALHHQVRADRRAVREPVGLGEHVAGGNARLAREQLEALDHPVHRGGAVRRRRLGVKDAALVIHRHAVGERAADVDAEEVGHGAECSHGGGGRLAAFTAMPCGSPQSRAAP